MKIHILGGGPSGLLAALAVLDYGHEPIIYEKSPRKPIPENAGVYYLHESCNLPLRHKEVQVIVRGAKPEDIRKAYALKVYGDETQTVSIPEHNSRERAYDGMQALAMTWDIVHNFVKQETIHSGLLESFDEPVVNTIPLSVLYPERTWHYERATIYRSKSPEDECYMMYMANPAVPWYRASAVFGAFTLEYPASSNPPTKYDAGNYFYVKKVVDTPESMPQLPTHVLLTGRYGAWSKRKLSHQAYYDTLRWLDGIV